MSPPIARTLDGLTIYAHGPAPLDSLVHSLRWIRERPLEHALVRIWDYERDHYGRRPRALVVSPRTRADLIVDAGAYPDKWTGVYAMQYVLGGIVTLFGIPLRIDPRVVGIVPE